MALLLDVLHTVEFLADLPEEDVAQFMLKGRARDFDRSHRFWRTGEPAEQVVIPVSGEAKCSTSNSDGREFIDSFFVSGECMGLVSAIDGLPNPTDATVARGGEFFFIGVSQFRSFMADHPHARERALQMTAALYRRARKDCEDGAMLPTTRRIAAFLHRHACLRQADGARVLLHATQSEIAASVGTVREMVTRAFAHFEKRGILHRDEHGTTITDWASLRAEAGIDPRADPADDAIVARERTKRFFRPAAERRRRNLETDDVTCCSSRVGDLSRCRDAGCPGAIDLLKNRR